VQQAPPPRNVTFSLKKLWRIWVVFFLFFSKGFTAAAVGKF